MADQEARVADGQGDIFVPDLARDLLEEIAIQARDSEYVDAKSGVSARLTISAMENLLSATERRSLINGGDQVVRMGDFWGVVPAITGKVELVYEGEQEGPHLVAQNLLGKAIRAQFEQYFPRPMDARRLHKRHPDAPKPEDPFAEIKDWFSQQGQLDILQEETSEDYHKKLSAISGLEKLVKQSFPEATAEEIPFLMEFSLHGMAECSQLSKNRLETGIRFGDLMDSVFSVGDFLDGEEEED